MYPSKGTTSATDLDVTIDSGSLADGLFLGQQVMRESLRGNFSKETQSSIVQLEIFKLCAKASMLQIWNQLTGWFGAEHHHADAFLVARVRGRTVGAMLLVTIAAKSKPQIVSLEYLVIRESWRKKGVGSRLVQEALVRTPSSTQLQVACVPNNFGMRRLLKKSGFKFSIPSQVIAMGIMSPVVYSFDTSQHSPSARYFAEVKDGVAGSFRPVLLDGALNVPSLTHNHTPRQARRALRALCVLALLLTVESCRDIQPMPASSLGVAADTERCCIRP